MILLKDGYALQAHSAKARDSSIELLRIISMFMIVMHHFAIHGGFSFAAQTLTVPRFWYSFIIMGGKTGVNIFVLISGYFLINDRYKFPKLKNVLKLLGQVLFYSVIFTAIFGFLGLKKITRTLLIETFLPVTYGSYWFASAYVVLYLLHPFINVLLLKLKKAEYQKLLALLLVIWCVIPTFLNSNYQSNNLLWFITVYVIAGYIRLHGLNERFEAKHYLLLWVIFTALQYLCSVGMMLLGAKSKFIYKNVQHFNSMQSIIVLLCAISAFMVFAKHKIRVNKFINIIASAAFGVYLIHDNRLVRQFLWKTFFNNAQFQDSLFIIPYSIIAAAAVYIVCTVIDLLRQKLFEKPYLKFVDFAVPRITACCEKAFLLFKKVL